MTPTARSMANLRKRGFRVGKVEQLVHMPGKPFPMKRDLFGFGDLLIMHPEEGIVMVQVTATGDMNRRQRKIEGNPTEKDKPKTEREEKLLRETAENARIWRESGGKILLHGWAKRGPRGKRKLWTLTEKML